MTIDPLAKRLRTRRKELGLSQSTLASKADLERKTIHNLEHGITKIPCILTIHKLAWHLDANLWDFLPTEVLKSLPPKEAPFYKLRELLHSDNNWILLNNIMENLSIYRTKEES